MAEQFAALSEELIEWIGRQHVFFVASAAPAGRSDSQRALRRRGKTANTGLSRMPRTRAGSRTSAAMTRF